MKHEGWSWVEPVVELSLSEPTIWALEEYERILRGRGGPMGIVSANDLPRLRDRHIVDSLRAAPLLTDAASAYDLGSGGGLPGMVLAIACPRTRFILVEVRRQRAAFLEQAATELGLANVTVYARRVETFRERAHVCLARAFAPPGASWAAAERLLLPGGRLVYWAGARFDPATDVPEGVAATLFRTPALARSGPLVIMSRQ